MTSLNRRGRLSISLQDDFEIIDVKLILETEQLREGEEKVEWIEDDSSPVTLFRVKTMLLIALLGLLFAGWPLLT